MEKRYEELLKKLKAKKIEYKELKELKATLEERIRICEESERCDEAASEYFVLKIVEEFMEKYKD
ncbi:hypothetical protein DRO97_04775 [Archaeoglobales archaeon]|nr:MAG: hypothetical protein DRO97_04775 [Archaeoglobales archaeon]